MVFIISCPFCKKELPDASVFCAYCGKKIREETIDYTKEPFSAKIEKGFQRTLETFRRGFYSLLSNLERRIENSTSISYVNKEKIMNTIRQFKVASTDEYNEQEKEEIKEWAKFVEEAISGSKCIICLQEFDLKDKEKIAVILCPSCSYAGHPKHFEDWLSEKSSCPMCRSELDKKSLVKGYLSLKEKQLVFSST
ncbi:MAG: RING finger domain-containing protein [Candidatus Thorarchaeota archaeon]